MQGQIQGLRHGKCKVNASQTARLSKVNDEVGGKLEAKDGWTAAQAECKEAINKPSRRQVASQ
jgi:hypothetical protein